MTSRALNDDEVLNEMNKMVAFIKQEASEKARELKIKADEEFAIEKAKIVRQESLAIDASFDKKKKQAETALKIAQSTSTNKSRLRVLQAREQLLQELFTDSRNKILDFSKDEGRYTQLLESIIVEGMLRILEPEVTVYSRKKDEKFMKAVADNAAKQYNEISGYKILATVEATLSDESAGGVKLTSGSRRITLDNTLDERLRLLEDTILPEIRKDLFGPNENPCKPGFGLANIKEGATILNWVRLLTSVNSYKINLSPMPVAAALQRKKLKITLAKEATNNIVFTSGNDVQRALSIVTPEALKASIQSLRNYLTLFPHELPIASSDARLVVARDWLDSSPGARDLFEIWENNSQNSAIDALCISTFAALLTLLSQYFIYHTYAEPVIRRLLDSQSLQKLNARLGSAHHELTLVTLKLFNAINDFGDGFEKRNTMDGFAWGLKSLPKLFNMRRRGANVLSSKDALARPDIRTLFILFLLSFITPGTPVPLKVTVLEDHKDLFMMIFKGLPEDPYAVVRHILEVCWEGIWCDSRLGRTTKIRVFGEETVIQLTKLYPRVEAETEDVNEIVADVVHHFLLAIATRPGTGLCFHDRGWFPPRLDDATADYDDGEISAHQQQTSSVSGRVHNKILRNLLKALRVNDDSRQQELALKIFAACPELVQGYWRSASISLEPRLSSRWIINAAFLGSIIALPVPTRCFINLDSKISSSSDTQPSASYYTAPPPLPCIIENVIPSIFTKEYISKGLLANSEPLVVHCTALVLSKIIDKLETTCTSLKIVEAALEENNETGLWALRRLELEKHVRRRVPEFQVIVALSQRFATRFKDKDPATPLPGNEPQSALLHEVALRLMWLYHRSFPLLVTEARFDPGKLLVSISDPVVSVPSSVSQGSAYGLGSLAQLHILRLLKESEQFSWSVKSAGISHSQLYTVLMLTTSKQSLISRAASDLTRILLSRTVLFEHDPLEVDTWMSVLPRTTRSPNAVAPDGTPLLDEASCLLAFLDECILRCMKTPYRYLEESFRICFGDQLMAHADRTIVSDPHSAPSPLFVTILEQFSVKLTKGLISLSEAMAIASYVRKLLLGLAGKLPNAICLERLSESVCTALQAQKMDSITPSIYQCIDREIRLISSTLNRLIRGDIVISPRDSQSGVVEFLAVMEVVSDESAISAYSAAELVDWIRLVDPVLSHKDIKRLINLAKRWPLADGALVEVFQHLEVSSEVVFDLLLDAKTRDPLIRYASERAILLSDPAAFIDYNFCTAFAKSYIRNLPPHRALHGVRLVTHIIQSLGASSAASEGFLLVLTNVVVILKSSPLVELSALKELLFKESAGLRSILRSNVIPVNTLCTFVQASLDPKMILDAALASDYCNYWMLQLRLSVTQMGYGQQSVGHLIPWIPYLSMDLLLECLDTVLTGVNALHVSPEAQLSYTAILETMLLSLQSSLSPETTVLMRTRIPVISSLARLQNTLPVVSNLLNYLVSSQLPIALNGSIKTSDVPLSGGRMQMLALTSIADARWVDRANHLDAVNGGDTLISVGLQSSTATALIYRSSRLTTDDVELFKASENSLVDILSPSLAMIDTVPVQEGSQIHKRIWTTLQEQIPAMIGCLASKTSSTDVKGIVARATLVVLRQGNARGPAIALLVNTIIALPFAHLCRVDLLHVLYRALGRAELRDIVFAPIVDRCLQLMVRQFSEEATDSPRLLEGLEVLARLVSEVRSVKPHLAEPVLLAGVQNRISVPTVVHFLSVLVKYASLKPITSNKLIQGIVQHRLFLIGTRKNTATQAPASRSPIIALLNQLFNLHPFNACQPSHITPLVSVYNGTVDVTDRQILSIFQLFENHRSLSIAPIFKLWSSTRGASPSLLGALVGLDPLVVMRTCTEMPASGIPPFAGQSEGAGLNAYDPYFLLSLLSSVILEETDSMSDLDWVALLRTNVASVALCALSSRDDRLRSHAMHVLFTLGHSIKSTDFQERDYTLFILNLARDMVPSPRHDSRAMIISRSPTPHSLLLAHALHCVFYPSKFMFPQIMRFLLQRPKVDKSDVPLLFASLYSTSDEWRQERAWIIRFLADSMTQSQDWKIFTRRHVWDLLGTIFQSSSEKSLRRGILEVLRRLAIHPRACTSLVLRSSLVGWVELQMLCLVSEEIDSWLNILENVVISVDHVKCDTATQCSWRDSLLSCLKVIVDTSEPSIKRLYKVSCICVRLAGTAPLRGWAIEVRIIQSILQSLKLCESDIEFSDEAKRGALIFQYRDPDASRRPGLSDTAPELWVWGRCVELMWDVVMSAHNLCGSSEWDALTSRLLIWNAISGDSVAGEWARKETIRHMRIIHHP